MWTISVVTLDVPDRIPHRCGGEDRATAVSTPPEKTSKEIPPVKQGSGGGEDGELWGGWRQIMRSKDEAREGKIGLRFGIPGFCVAHVSTSVQLIDFHCYLPPHLLHKDLFLFLCRSWEFKEWSPSKSSKRPIEGKENEFWRKAYFYSWSEI